VGGQSAESGLRSRRRRGCEEGLRRRSPEEHVAVGLVGELEGRSALVGDLRAVAGACACFEGRRRERWEGLACWQMGEGKTAANSGARTRAAAVNKA